MTNHTINAPTIYRHMVNSRLWVRLELAMMRKHDYEWQRIYPKKILSVAMIDKLEFPIRYKRKIGQFTGTIDIVSSICSIDEKYWHMSSFVIASEHNDPNIVFKQRQQNIHEVGNSAMNKGCRVKYIGDLTKFNRIRGVEEEASELAYKLVKGEEGIGLYTDDPKIIEVQFDTTWPFSHQWNAIPIEALMVRLDFLDPRNEE